MRGRATPADGPVDGAKGDGRSRWRGVKTLRVLECGLRGIPVEWERGMAFQRYHKAEARGGIRLLVKSCVGVNVLVEMKRGVAPPGASTSLGKRLRKVCC